MEFIGAVARRNAQRNIGFQFAIQPLAELTAGDELAFATAERSIVDTEDHVQRWFIDLHARHWQRIVDGANRVAEFDLAEAFDSAEIACENFGHFTTAKTFEAIDLERTRLAHTAVSAADRHGHAALEHASEDATNRDTTDIVTPSEIRHEHLKWRGFICAWMWNASDDFLEEFIDALVARVWTARSPTIAA